MPNLRYVVAGSDTTLLTGANLNAAADGALLAGATTTHATNGHLFATVMGKFKFAGNTTAGSQIDVWWTTTTDGSVVEDASLSVQPSRPPDFSFIIAGKTGTPHTQIIRATSPDGSPLVRLPASNAVPLIKLQGTGSALSADTDSLIWMRTVTIGTV